MGFQCEKSNWFFLFIDAPLDFLCTPPAPSNLKTFIYPDDYSNNFEKKNSLTIHQLEFFRKVLNNPRIRAPEHPSPLKAPISICPTCKNLSPCSLFSLINRGRWAMQFGLMESRDCRLNFFQTEPFVAPRTYVFFRTRTYLSQYFAGERREGGWKGGFLFCGGSNQPYPLQSASFIFIVVSAFLVSFLPLTYLFFF